MAGSRVLMRMHRTAIVSILFSLTLSFPSVGAGDEAEPGSKLIVHEWGVLQVGKVGGQTVLGTSNSGIADLPAFVYLNEKESPQEFTERRPMVIRKPVIHLYGEQDQKVEIIVSVNHGGSPIAYYPKPAITTTKTTVIKNGRHGELRHATAMIWNFHLSKKSPGDLVEVPEGHWWNAARKIPSDYAILEDGGQAERFIFYEGTTFREPTMTAMVAKDSVTVTNTHSADSSPAILIINDVGSFRGVEIPQIGPGKSTVVTAEDFEDWSVDELTKNCRSHWESFGMTPAEAAGIVESWRPELLEVPGFLLITRIPDPVYDDIFPIKISPQPVELVRACLIFNHLAGQNARKHWTPKIGEQTRVHLASIATDDFKERMRARGKILSLGECALPFLDEFLSQSPEDLDAEMRAAATTLRKRLSQSPVDSPPHPGPLLRSGGGLIPAGLEVPRR